MNDFKQAEKKYQQAERNYQQAECEQSPSSFWCVDFFGKSAEKIANELKRTKKEKKRTQIEKDAFWKRMHSLKSWGT